MSGLRSLAVCYLAAASVFTMAGAMSAHRVSIHDLSARLREGVAAQAANLSRLRDGQMFQRPLFEEPGVRIDIAPPGPNDARDLAHVVLPPIVRQSVTPREPIVAPLPLLIAPDLPQVAEVAPVPHRPMSVSPDSSLTPAQRVAVLARLKENLSPDLLKNFSMFLYVSKAASGPLAQRLYVVQKNADGELILAHDWAASTGREEMEISPRGRRSFTGTPHGYYQLDPDRMYRRYQSYSWNQSMPYSMFFNWENNGVQTGLAIHSASGDADIAKLGRRASAGCVHLSPQHARQLYEMIRADYRGPTPRFAYRGDTMSNQGELMRDRTGHIKMADGYQVLIFIEDFGGENVVAALF